jgi:hypothetical protein
MIAGVIVYRVSVASAAVLLLACSVPLLIAEVFPRSSAGRMIAMRFPVGSVHANLAELAFAQGDWDDAEAHSRAELSISPVRQDAWLRLARTDVARRGALTRAGTEALIHSYEAEPYDLSPRGLRRCFVRAHFAGAPPALAEAVEAEHRVLSDRGLASCSRSRAGSAKEAESSSE